MTGETILVEKTQRFPQEQETQFEGVVALWTSEGCGPPSARPDIRARRRCSPVIPCGHSGVKLPIIPVDKEET